MPLEQNNSSAGMSAPEVGDYLRVSLSTVHHLTRTGKLKARKQGKRWTYLKADVDRYINEGFPKWAPRDEVSANDRRAHARRPCHLSGRMKLEGRIGNDSSDWAHGRVLNISEQGMLFEVSRQEAELLGPLVNLPAAARFSIVPQGTQQVPYVFQGTLLRAEPGEGLRFGVLLEAPMGHLLELQSIPAN